MKIINILLIITTTGLTQMLYAQNVGIGTNTPAALLHANGTGTGEGNILFTGQLKSLAGDPPVSGFGTRMMWYPDKAAFRVGRVTASQWDIGNIGNVSNAWGENTIASGSRATAWGLLTTASGLSATAWGWNSTASGADATAWGRFTIASGADATAWGVGTTASGTYSTAWGTNTTASGVDATALGNNTIAPSFAETVIGHYNTLYTPLDAEEWNNADRLFVIGNGTFESNRSNALTILKNGRTGINWSSPSARLHINAPTGEDGLRILSNNLTTRLRAASNGGLSIGSATTPPPSGLSVLGESSMQLKVNIGSTAVADATLHIRHSNATAGILPDQGLRIQNTSGIDRIWNLYTFSSSGALALYAGTSGVSVGNFNAGTGAYTATSNRHLKTNVQLLDGDVLTRIQQLQPATYSYLRDPLQQRTVGFMAEDVQPIFPELVDTIGENGENLAINYAGFSVVAIKAIQLLQEKMDEKEKRIETLEAEMKEIKKLMMGMQ